MNWFLSPPLDPDAKPVVRVGEDLSWQWSAAIQALEELSILSWPVEAGFLLAGPAPIFAHPQLTPWIFAPLANHQACLPPTFATTSPEPITLIPISPADPLATHPFCLLLSPAWNLVLSFDGELGLKFSFDPADILQAWQQLELRLKMTAPHCLSVMADWLLAHPPQPPDYHLVTDFSQALLRELIAPQPRTFGELNLSSPAPELSPGLETEEEQFLDIELLQALTHEVRTPLTTIQTLIQLLLKRADLPADVHHRLQAIAQECHDQVNRFSLLFHAAELMADPAPSPLTGLSSVSVEEILQDNIPRWQKQAQRRHLALDMQYPAKLPAVTSDPNLLDQVLTGLVEHFSQTLPPRSTLEMRFSLAGSQLKVQLKSSEKHRSQTLAAVGKMLMWQPETGHLSLNLSVTKTLFHALGGKLTVRHDHRWGDILTLYLPLNQEHQAY
ncbi:sensor histidine kinase KdpD [Synechococcus sp. PCC 6312]|uniref:sensor histidine kinase n=1 Tax=Synechococcus sp. (strain ATCC 27167 / PCC 6312) TaxID=195253 RepID=UPI00029F474F|nr:HAMP domain-containing sensor histidine kinase [Synechococcus sp. PCC 6312]AFY62285.1 signal transduction histidine kinase [Synechococcus sp. PCC 6312]